MRGTLLISGVCGSLGAYCAKALIDEGYHVIGIDKDINSSVQIDGIDYVSVDASDHAEIENFFARLGKRNLDGLVNCVGQLYSQPLFSLFSEEHLHGLDTWDACIQNNLTVPFILARSYVNHQILLRSEGVIINFSSISARGRPGQCAYSAAKAGLEGFTRAIAKEVGVNGIRAVCIAPGYIETDSMREAISTNVVDEIVAATPLKRLGEKADVVKTVLYCLETQFLTGVTLSVDGGLVV